MVTYDKNPQLFAGIDNLSLDRREFQPKKEDIERICRFFTLGKPLAFEKEKGVTVSHSNFFVFVETTRGQYALKFYPEKATTMIATEHTINRFLINKGFLTPVMYEGYKGQPAIASNDLLATCFTYINGSHAWQLIKKRTIIHQINTALLTLKDTLLTTNQRIPFLKQDHFIAMVNNLVQTSRAIPIYDQKKLIESIILKTCRVFEGHQALFERQRLHNNATLNNFLIEKNGIYTLDLSHIREDYILTDLAALIISCLFLDIPRSLIKPIIEDYFIQHNFKRDKKIVLNTLIQMGLIHEYLKNIQREYQVELPASPPEAVKMFKALLKARKKLIIEVLNMLNGKDILYGWAIN